MDQNRALPIDWSRDTLKADVVAREISSLRPFRFTSITLPPVAEEDFALLVDSVQAHGVVEPLTITGEGEVVDGQARLDAAKAAALHQVPTRLLEVRGGEEDYAVWAVVVNVGRRHLKPSQRLTLVRAVLKLLEAQARRRQRATRFGHGGPRALGAVADPASRDLDAPSGTADVRARLGDLLGVSRSQAPKMVALVKHGSDDLQTAVATGRTSIHRAHETLRVRSAGRACQDPEPRAREALRLRDFTRDPVGTLRLVAGLIPEWIHASEAWVPPRRSESGRAPQNMRLSDAIVVGGCIEGRAIAGARVGKATPPADRRGAGAAIERPPSRATGVTPCARRRQ